MEGKLAEVKRMISVRKFQSGLELINKALPTVVGGHPESLHWITLKVYCLIRLGEFGRATDELTSLGPLEAAKFLTEGADGQHTSAVPFCLRLMSSYLPHLSGNTFVALERMYLLHRWTLSRCAGKSEAWKEREKLVSLMLGDLHCTRRQFEDALGVLGDSLKRNPNDSELLAAMGRICLEVGELNGMDQYIQAAALGKEQDPETFNNRGLACLAKWEISSAVRDFSEAVQGFQLETPSQGSTRIASNTNSGIVAANNLAVAYLYNSMLSEATGTLEAAMNADAGRYIFPVGLRNLNFLYEFSAKKDVFQSTLAETVRRRPAEDDFDIRRQQISLE